MSRLLLDKDWAVTESEGIGMPITASQLKALYPPAEDEQNQSVCLGLAQLMKERFSQQFAETVASFAKVNFEFEQPRYLPPPPTLLPIQRQDTTIVINVFIDLPPQE